MDDITFRDKIELNEEQTRALAQFLREGDVFQGIELYQRTDLDTLYIASSAWRGETVIKDDGTVYSDSDYMWSRIDR